MIARPSRNWLLWASCLLLVLSASIFARPDIPLDETRYIGVAWEMWSGGDWLLMHDNGQPYPDKPPLLFWLIGLGWRVLGLHDGWPRAVSALFSFACLGLTAAIARRLWPNEAGVGERAAWFLLGGTFWLFFSTAVMFDVMLTAFTLLALLAALQVWRDGRYANWGLFGAAVGLGLLAKGPVVLLFVLPPLLAAPWWGAKGAQGRRWYIGLGFGVLLGAAIALAWAIPAAVRGGEEFRNAIFWGQTAGRVSGTLAHKQPFWFYAAILPVLLFPWFFWGEAWRATASALCERTDMGTRFCLAWTLPAFLVFSLSGGKQMHYLLPLLPAFALLPARGWSKAGREGRGTMIVPLALLFVFLGGLLLFPQFWAAKLWLAPFAGLEWRWAGALLAALGIVCIFLGRGEGGLPKVALASVVGAIVLIVGVLGPLSPVFDMVPMAQRLRQLEMQGVPVAHVGDYNDQYRFYGRLQKPLAAIGHHDIDAWFATHPEGRVVAYLKHAEDADAVRPEFWQRYLDGAALLLDAEAAKRMPASGK